MKNEKTLMFQISVSLPKSEALGFGKTMTTDEPYYIYRVRENENARDNADRESWVVCRYPRKGEIVKGCYVLWVNEAGLECVDRGEKKAKKVA